MFNKSLKEFSEITASKEPVPGGGGVSGAVASLASALSQMVCNLTIGKQKYLEYTFELNEIQQEADILRTNLLKAINDDANAFYPLSKAYAMDKNSEGYEELMEKCLVDAANSPLLILKYCTRIIELDDRLAEIGSKLSVSDAGTSVMLAYGAMYGAYINVKVNTRLMKNKQKANEIETEAKQLLDEYSVLANKCYEKVLKRLA